MGHSKVAYGKVAAPSRTAAVARESWNTFPYLTGVMVLLTLVSIFHVWSRVEVIDLNLKISESARLFKDEQQESKRLEITAAPSSAVPTIRFDYRQTAGEIATQRRHEERFASGLKALRCFPIGKVDPGKAGSIHYAGTIPFQNPFSDRFHANPDCTLAGTRNVYLGDGAPWNFLPAKGLSFTLMANALRVAALAAKSL